MMKIHLFLNTIAINSHHSMVYISNQISVNSCAGYKFIGLALKYEKLLIEAISVDITNTRKAKKNKKILQCMFIINSVTQNVFDIR